MSLPTHQTASRKLRFVVQSTDVLQEMRINVSDENSNRVIWYKERYLSDQEIVEHIVHNSTKAICWTIHKPKRGWYIRLRHPSFPPGTFIPFIPVPPSSPYHTDGALSFNSRTSGFSPFGHIAKSSDELDNQSVVRDNTGNSSPDSKLSIHVYPPTPPPAVIRQRSTASVASTETGDSTQQQTTMSPKMASRVPRPMEITRFILAPHSLAPQIAETDSFFSRAMSMMRSHRPSHSRSFTLSRVPHSSQSLPPPYTSQSTVTLTADVEASPSTQPLTPFLVHHDRTPVLTFGSFTGLIEIDAVEEKMLGVDRSFWIAVSLTYLEFLENRESYLAALQD